LYGQACTAGILDQIYEFGLLVKDLSADPRIGAIPTAPVNFLGHRLSRPELALQTTRAWPGGLIAHRNRTAPFGISGYCLPTQ
jgi:hypothetical protein